MSGRVRPVVCSILLLTVTAKAIGSRGAWLSAMVHPPYIPTVTVFKGYLRTHPCQFPLLSIYRLTHVHLSHLVCLCAPAISLYSLLC